jgi:hypothetical protein
MDCDWIEGALDDFLDGRLEGAARSEVERHLEACSRCRAVADELRGLIEQLEQEAARTGPAAAAEVGSLERRRFERVLEAFRLGASQRGRPAAKAGWLAAAGLVLGLAIGALRPWSWVGRDSASPPASGDATMPRFLLALREPFAATPPEPQEARRIVGEYAAWARALAGAGRLVGAEKLRDDQRVLLRERSAGLELERALPAAGEGWTSGFFLLRARDLDEAIELASGSPHLRYGGEIEIRTIEETDR